MRIGKLVLIDGQFGNFPDCRFYYFSRTIQFYVCESRNGGQDGAGVTCWILWDGGGWSVMVWGMHEN